MPSYKDTNGKWHCQFYYTDHTGERKKKFKRGFDRKKDADAWERHFLEYTAMLPDISFSTLCDRYINDKNASASMQYAHVVGIVVNNIIRPYFGSKQAKDITPADCREFQLWLHDQKKKNGEPFSANYKRTTYGRLSAILNYGVKYCGLPNNPCRIAGGLPHETRKPSFWTPDQFDVFIDTFSESDPARVAFLTLYYTGLRIGELLALTVSDINLSERVLSVSKTLYREHGEIYITPPKTPTSNRDVVLPPFLCDILEQHISKTYKPDPDTRIFRETDKQLRKMLNEHADATGLPRIRLHDFRHSHASLLIELGFSALLVAERLGHANVNITLNTYSHLFPSKQSQVADRLQSLVESK